MKTPSPLTSWHSKQENAGSSRRSSFRLSTGAANLNPFLGGIGGFEPLPESGDKGRRATADVKMTESWASGPSKEASDSGGVVSDSLSVEQAIGSREGVSVSCVSFSGVLRASGVDCDDSPRDGPREGLETDGAFGRLKGPVGEPPRVGRSLEELRV